MMQDIVVVWIDKILHQLLDGLSHDYPVVYRVS